MGGFAGAFREPSVIAAIAATGGSGIAVSMIQWSDNRRQEVAVDWQVLTDEDSVADFATAIDNTPRFLDGGGTAIGGAIEFSLRSEEHTSELQSLMRISYAVFCLQKKNKRTQIATTA